MARRIAFALPILSLFVGVLSAQGPTPDATVLPVTRVVLYKTGIGYFEHLGTVTGNQSLAVQFTGDQLDDVLKSLTAVDLGAGRVTGIGYDSPTPAERRLQALRVPLAQDASTLQVLEALRGSRIEVRTAGSTVAGRLLDVERRTREAVERIVERDEITLVTDAGEIVTLELDRATRVRVADADLRRDVSRYLDIAATNGDRSPRRVVLSTAGTGQRQILVSYVGEAAVWKTTYRLILPSTGAGQPLLQGWAIVDNLSAADWDGVELSLVAGAPQAFRQPLAAPLFAVRPFVPLTTGPGLAPQIHGAALVGGVASMAGVVRDNAGGAIPGARVTILDPSGSEVASAITDSGGRYRLEGLVPGRIEVTAELEGFQTVRLSGLEVPSSGTLQRDFRLEVGSLTESVSVTADSPARRRVGRASGVGGGVVGGVVGGVPAPPPMFLGGRLPEQAIAASGAELGELFEYRLKDRVTIKRSQSALVPILQTNVKAERISLWNDAMGPRPRRAVWLTNTSDLTLDAGALAVIDGGAFAGEGLVDPVGPGARRLVSFASDLGVQVAARPDPGSGRITRVRIAKGVMTQDSEQRQRRAYTIRNDDREARIVVVEHPARPDWTLAAGSTPVETTASAHRFRVTANPGQTTTLVVDELKRGATTQSVGDFDRERLLLIAGPGDGRAALERAMAPIFAKSAELAGIQHEVEKRQIEMTGISGDQERVRKNMAVLKGSASERRLLERYTQQLDAQETRLDVLRRESAELSGRQTRVREELDTLMMAVTIDVAL